jgi:magnesium chelatase family protein
LLDRIDIQIRVPRVTYKELTATEKAESSAVIRKRVSKARDRQLARLGKYGIVCNAQMTSSILKKTCKITQKAQSGVLPVKRTVK